MSGREGEEASAPFAQPDDVPPADNKIPSTLDPEEHETMKVMQKAVWELFERFESKLIHVHSTAALHRERISESFRHLHQYLLKEEQARLVKNEDQKEKAITDLQEKISLLSNLSSSIATMLFQLENGKLSTQDAQQLDIFKAQFEDFSKFNVAPHDFVSPLRTQEWRGVKHVVKPLKKTLHFDPSSGHSNLVLSKNLKQVRFSVLPKPVKSINCFEPGLYILGVPGFQSGQHYWEVDVGLKSNWIVGVVKESVPRKEPQDLLPAKGFWVLNKQREDVYTACGLPSPKSMLAPLRIGVFIDILAGHLAFYNGDTTNVIFEVTGCQFEGMLYPFFCPGVPVHEEDLGPLTLIN